MTYLIERKKPGKYKEIFLEPHISIEEVTYNDEHCFITYKDIIIWRSKNEEELVSILELPIFEKYCKAIDFITDELYNLIK